MDIGGRDLHLSGGLRQRRRVVRVRDTTVTWSIGRTATIPSRCALPWLPAPNMTRREASGAAKCFVATADTAAVRVAVSASPSINARGTLVSASNRT